MVYIPPLKPLGSILTIDESDSRYIARINEEVELEDGARIRMNVFLPRTEGPKWPVLMASSPYGKDVNYRTCKEYAHSGNEVPEDHACEHLNFEAASPAYWCPRGYAVVYWDHRGCSQSPGYFKTWCSQHFDDYAQIIPWAADQPWSTGKIGLTGISYLGSNQWPTAARKPRGLTCICPWEGFGDFYREATRHGGIASTVRLSLESAFCGLHLTKELAMDSLVPPTGCADSVRQPRQDESLSGAPIPTFLDARSSPEPHAGQGLRFDDYLRKTFANRRHLRNPAGNLPTNATSRGSKVSDARPEKAHHPPLMGDFSPSLTSEGGDTIWEPENLAHVRSLPQQTYDQIVARFKQLNRTNGQYTQFVTGNFPSLAACNAFMRLFFEEFNPLFPLLHQPTFDPAIQPWLLVLAVIATGCRFSQISAAVECVDILQEFVRRAFYATIEEDYGSTCEPWLAQAGLLNQIGMQLSKDLRLTESAQSMRSLLASICRKVNCFNESERLLETPQSNMEAWKSWVRKESMCRLAYILWLVDSQFVLFFDLPPIIPTKLLRVQLPSLESLWHAPTASSWMESLEQNSIYLPLSVRQELNNLYKTRTRRQGFGEFAILLLVVGVFRNALEFRGSFQEGFGLQPSAVQNDPQQDPESESMPETFPGTRKAMEYLRILCPENEEEVTRLSSLKSAIILHYHTIGILLGIPLGELFCYCGYRVTSADISRCQNRLRVWVQQRGREARQMAAHAGRVFGCIRHSNMYGYYEGRVMMIACLSLWIYGETAGLHPTLNRETTIDGIGHISTSTIRLDQHLSRQVEQSWVQNGAEMRPYLAGVGNILGADGVSRLVQEGSRILCASSTWPLCGAMGKALSIFHKLRSGTGS